MAKIIEPRAGTGQDERRRGGVVSSRAGCDGTVRSQGDGGGMAPKPVGGGGDGRGGGHRGGAGSEGPASSGGAAGLLGLGSPGCRPPVVGSVADGYVYGCAGARPGGGAGGSGGRSTGGGGGGGACGVSAGEGGGGGGGEGAAGAGGTKSPSMPHAYSEVTMENHEWKRVW